MTSFLEMARGEVDSAWQAGGSDYEHAQRQKILADWEKLAGGIGNGLATAALDASQLLGESVWNEMQEIEQDGVRLLARISNREVPHADGRRQMDALLIRFDQARAKKRSFEAALDSAAEILADPVAAGDALWTKYPTTRPRIEA